MKTPALRQIASFTTLLGATLGATLGACAQDGGAPLVRGLRVVVATETDVTALDDFMRRIARAAGVSARDAVFLGDGRRSLAVTLECRDETACQRAYEKLEAERGWITGVRRDERRGLPTPVRP